MDFFNDSFDSAYHSETEVDRIHFQNPEIERILEDYDKNIDLRNIPFNSNSELWYDNTYALSFPIPSNCIEPFVRFVFFDRDIWISDKSTYRLACSVKDFLYNLQNTHEEFIIVEETENTIDNFNFIYMLISLSEKYSESIYVARMLNDAHLVCNKFWKMEAIQSKGHFKTFLETMLNASSTIKQNYTCEHPFYGWRHMNTGNAYTENKKTKNV